MMLTLSLTTKIRLIFAFLFILLFLAFLPFHKMQEMQADENVLKSYERVMHHLKERRLSREESIEYLQTFNFTLVYQPRKILDSLNKRTIGREDFEAFHLEGSYYLHIRTPHFRVLLKDETNKFKRSYLDFYILLFVALLFAFIYYLILKNIKDTQHQLKSRQLFLRTIMHELKTPIAKGRIVSELIDDEKQKKRIITIFEKLNFLIDDFAKVEQIVSKNYMPNIYDTSLESALKRAIAMLMLESSENILCQNITPKKINVDLELFAMALKNLIDNALKYASDAKVTIRQEGDELHFISLGERLPKPLEEYFKPFHNDTKLKNHGMGLGLYIVNAILQMHGMTLKYEFRENRNLFIIILNS